MVWRASLVSSSPLTIQPLLGTDSTPELKTASLSVLPVPPVWIEDKYSSYYKLVHVTAWCQCYVSNLQASVRKHSLTLTLHLNTNEIEMSEHLLFRKAQSYSFPNELYHLIMNNPIESSSPLMSLTPLVDKLGLIRVGGRLSHSHFGQSLIHPIILSSKSKIADCWHSPGHVCWRSCRSQRRRRGDYWWLLLLLLLLVLLPLGLESLPFLSS